MLKPEHISVFVAVVIIMVGFMSSGETSGRQAEFTGRVIDVGGDYVELKRGARELRLEYTADTKFFDIKGAETDKGVIELCQMVKAVYLPVSRAGQPASIVIIKEGNCRK
ncbi:MAG: hypothetical protein MUC76_09575 [Spirochaetes bacterium]|jgi:hypothetical protein|nr:hypothetical protein [Spirochaetota bacterium]